MVLTGCATLAVASLRALSQSVFPTHLRLGLSALLERGGLGAAVHAGGHRADGVAFFIKREPDEFKFGLIPVLVDDLACGRLAEQDIVALFDPCEDLGVGLAEAPGLNRDALEVRALGFVDVANRAVVEDRGDGLAVRLNMSVRGVFPSG